MTKKLCGTPKNTEFKTGRHFPISYVVHLDYFKSNMFFLCKFRFAWIIDIPRPRGHCKFPDECLGGIVLEK